MYVFAATRIVLYGGRSIPAVGGSGGPGSARRPYHRVAGRLPAFLFLCEVAALKRASWVTVKAEAAEVLAATWSVA